MAVPENLCRVTMHGRLGGSEIALWGFHVRIGTDAQLTEPQRQQVADRVRDAWLSAAAGKNDLFSGAYQLEHVRLDWLDPAIGGPELDPVASPVDNSPRAPPVDGKWSSSSSMGRGPDGQFPRGR